jgi:hypothetical protein
MKATGNQGNLPNVIKRVLGCVGGSRACSEGRA